jgi:hypothetical protein
VFRRDTLAFALTLGAASAGAVAGCRCQSEGPRVEALPSALPAGIPVSASVIASVLNPFKAPRYEGPVGAVVGVVRVEGDAPPALGGRAPPPACPAAQAAYSHLFRKGPAGQLADAIVGVTDYPGYLLPRGDAVRATVRECAYSARTYTLTFGQRLEVANEDPKERYLPRLEGSRYVSQMFAMPGGDAVKLYPTEPGRYALIDDLNHPWMHADVFVLKYPAHAVTRVDGTFRVENVPAGKARVHAGHPMIAEGTSREIEVRAGEETKVELTLTYRAEAPSASASAPGPARSAPIIR